MMLRSLAVAFVLAQTVTPQCGSSSTSSVANTQMAAVDAGPNQSYFNGAFTTVTLCVSGTTTCQTIPDLLIDTGSSGVRVLASVLTLSLPQASAGNASLVECNQFLDGVTWGAVRTADVKLAGEQANSVPVQVIGDPAFSSIPAECTKSGKPEQTLNDLGANGILGVGLFRQDCGNGCATSGASNPGMYFACSGAACQVTTASLAQQLQNPVWMFPQDNNGIVLQFPSVTPGGQATVNGVITFGIGSQSNNGLGGATVFTTDFSGNFTTVYAGKSYSNSFIDSGSNGIFFLDSATTGFPLCSSDSSFYCPAGTQNRNATHQGLNGKTAPVVFQIGNAETLLNTLAFSAFAEIGGPNAGGFDWGMPFFYGHTVFTAIENQMTPGGTGPFWAY